MELTSALCVTFLKNETAICDSVASSIGGSAKVLLTVNEKSAVIMEVALSLWTEDCLRKNVALDSNIIYEKARSLYSSFAPHAPDDPQPGTSSEDP